MMKLSLVKPLSAMFASIVMCGVFSLSFSSIADKHCQSEHLKPSQNLQIVIPCYFADGKVLGWEQYMTPQEKRRLEEAFKEIEQLEIELINPVKVKLPKIRI